MPEFDSQNTYDIIGFPDFIYLESPVSIPVVQFQAFDNDKNGSFLEQIHMESTVLQFNLSFQTQRLSSRDTSVCRVQRMKALHFSLQKNVILVVC